MKKTYAAIPNLHSILLLKNSDLGVSAKLGYGASSFYIKLIIFKIEAPLSKLILILKVIWADMGLTKHPQWNNNVEANKYGIAATCKAVVEMKKPNLYDLIELHIKARGIRCDKKEDADIIFDIDDGITPFDTEIFMGEYL